MNKMGESIAGVDYYHLYLLIIVYKAIISLQFISYYFKQNNKLHSNCAL